MSDRFTDAVKIQRKYYEDTATRYDVMHAHEGASDDQIGKIVHGMMRMLEVRSVLDVGTATGLGVCKLKSALPDAFVCGVEPVAGLLKQAIDNGAGESGSLICGSGQALPFPNESFEAVCEFAILHHVENPNSVVREMLRVARKAVFLCDSNRFGQGPVPVRFAKLALYKCGLWRAYNWLRTGGKGYLITEGDGLAYSYSVYDSLELLAEWADRVILIPSEAGTKASWFHPLLTSAGVIVCAIRNSGKKSERWPPCEQ
jgi:ubiquinone/menaquinone biosynthesis C-methylase UbiE